MLLVPFLTTLDPNAAVKGSRDPLGAQVVWTRLGRNVVTNLTTVTTSANDFNALLLGIYFAQRLEAGEARPEAFLRWEQVAAYSRTAYGNSNGPALRGIERVRKNLEGASRVDISADAVDQILSDQRMYGLWGLYVGAARSSGLLEEDAVRLTPMADTYLKAAFGNILEYTSAIMKLVEGPRSKLEFKKGHRELCTTVGEALSRTSYPKRMREPLWSALVANEKSSRIEQHQLAALLGQPEFLQSDSFSREFVLRLQYAARDNGYDELFRRLDRIVACESVLAPASAAFSFILSCDRMSVPGIVESFKEQWPEGAHVDLGLFASLAEEIGGAVMNPEVNTLWQRVAESLFAGDYQNLIHALVNINRLVMGARGGAPWADIKAEYLELNIKGEDLPLPDKDELRFLWRYPYFLRSIQSIAWQLRKD